MPVLNKVLEHFQTQRYDSKLEKLYGNDVVIIENQRERYIELINHFANRFGNEEVSLFTSPGRTEIGGNHTDHNLGKVLAGSINLDCIGVASKRNDDKVIVLDTMNNLEYEIDINKTEKIRGEKGTLALIRGIIGGFKGMGYNVGGFNLCETSNVISAAGVSSSASFEMLLTCIINEFYNHGDISVSILSKIGQFAENEYWDKKSGLLDQMSCGLGGIVSIDFANPDEPMVEKVDFDFESKEYSLMIVNTGGSHADLSEEYSAVPSEMKSVADMLGGNVLRDVSVKQIIQNIPSLRQKLGDRAILRAFHYFEENNRVDKQVDSLKNNRFNDFLHLINESGNSSWKWLQNCYTNTDLKEQGVTLCLALTEMFIKEIGKGACRVHGGGFAGVIVAYIPNEHADEYMEFMEGALNRQCVFPMTIRNYGAVCFEQI